MANVRVSRKSLKEPDEFISFSSKLLQQALLHKTILITAGGVLIGTMMLVSGLLYFSEKAENKGSLLLSRAMNRYAVAKKDSGPEKAYEMVSADFQKILDDYSGRNCGKFARINFATICYQSANYDKAITLYTQAMDDFKAVPLLKNIAVSGLGYAYEEKKEYARASELFESLSTGANAIMADEALLTLGRLYGLLGKKDKRSQVLSRIAESYPESIYKDMAREGVAG
jgi:tetratricopeptide (TPR) repeat protein